MFFSMCFFDGRRYQKGPQIGTQIDEKSLKKQISKTTQLLERKNNDFGTLWEVKN
jgi:hypothetical protein